MSEEKRIQINLKESEARSLLRLIGAVTNSDRAQKELYLLKDEDLNWRFTKEDLLLSKDVSTAIMWGIS